MDTRPTVVALRQEHPAGSERRFQASGIDYPAVVSAAADWTTVTGPDGRYRYVSSACHHLLGWAKSELEGSSADDFVHPEDQAEFRQVRDAVSLADPALLTYRLRGRDGSFRWVEESCAIVRASQTTLLVSTVRDITQRRAHMAALERRATSDPLTGLVNRAVVMDRLQHALRRIARDHRSLAVLYLDLDRFKAVNDSLGHQAGDEVLRQMAERLAGLVRPSDTLARLGGDEFVIVAEGIDEAKAVDLAHRVLEAGHLPFDIRGRRLTCTVSLGLTCTSDSTRRAHELLHEADIALYRAKDTGRDHAEVFDGALQGRG
jgi:diguanylate cyclase (GGDEF)-like protein/PAS domain S-box-containing protein